MSLRGGRMGKRVGVTYRNPKKAEPYAQALRAAGIEPVLIGPGSEPPIDELDGLLLSGGTDLNPSLFGEEPNAANDEPDDARDAMEKQMLEAALERDMPVLAICRGMQLFNVAHGGTLQQDVAGHRSPGVAEAHRIEVKTGTRLADAMGSGSQSVNSRHHQIVGKVGAGLRVSAVSEEGYPEALERDDKRFALAVQWHPEDLVESRAEAKRLFEAFAKAL
jgi:putative glutamine amidotransferase